MKNKIIVADNFSELQQIRSQRFTLLEEFETDLVSIKDKAYKIRKGFTFTPFANPKACNAHCTFCSEELIPANKTRNSSKNYIVDYDTYFESLNSVLTALSGLHVNLSLSGLEATIDYNWLEQLLTAVKPHLNVKEKVLYTNGSGLTNQMIVDLLVSHRFDKVELSRAHFDEDRNQRIMLFNKNVSIRNNRVFSELLTNIAGNINLKLSCILNKQGIKNLSDIKLYLNWAMAFNCREVVFRELSLLDGSYTGNKTYQWIEENRIGVVGIMEDVMHDNDFVYQHSTGGYYYYNEAYIFRSTLLVIFETSSYSELKNKNSTGIIHKLIFHSNGNLTTDWDSETSVISNFYE